MVAEQAGTELPTRGNNLDFAVVNVLNGEIVMTSEIVDPIGFPITGNTEISRRFI
jgi:hypothetical protein